jgi:phosphate:Na+ symporter
MLVVLHALFQIAGGLCLFLFGMRLLSEGIQQAAGDKLHKVLNFMTANRFIAVMTGILTTAAVQSSSAVTVMLVSFVNAGLITLEQSIGVIFGSNIGTTTTAWIVSLIGFKVDISALAMPVLTIGFIMNSIKWKHRDVGQAFIGFAFIFIGLEFMTNAIPRVKPEQVYFIQRLSDMGFLSLLIALLVGVVLTLLMHSSAAVITLVITLAYSGVVGFSMGCAITLGANIGTTIDAILASVGAKTAAKRTALVHVLFNVLGALIVLIVFTPFIDLVNLIMPLPNTGANLTAKIALFHTLFNVMVTLLFLPFTKQLARLVSFLIKEKPGEAVRKTYTLKYRKIGTGTSAPELNVMRAVKEIGDMSALVMSMYKALEDSLRDVSMDKIDATVSNMTDQEELADEMRDALTEFLMQCTHDQLSIKSQHNVSLLFRVIADLEDMTDDCYSVILLIQKSVRKDRVIHGKELEALAPYMALVEQFLGFVRDHVGGKLNREQSLFAQNIENNIDENRTALRHMGRDRIEAGKNVKIELFFIDLVRKIEHLGDYCYSISGCLANMW